MNNLLETFQSLDNNQKRLVHLELCRHALKIWENYIAQFEKIAYVESVVGTYQVVDKLLPNEAFEAVIDGRDTKNIDWRYAEPINAMHEDDLEFSANIGLAYYAIYNLFNKYVMQRKTDDWLICNQALSAETDSERWQDLLNDPILKAL